MKRSTQIGIVSGALVLLLGVGMALLLSKAEKYPDGLSWKAFDSYWSVESESPDYRVEFVGEGVEITAPKGLTMWYRKPVEAPCVIEYDARVMQEREGDRLSDLNCFWMASDPAAEDVFARAAERGGKFANCATLQLYYVGYGGNYNSTTRFRRYNGMPDPALLQEYTDPAHLLEANRWYHIRLVCGAPAGSDNSVMAGSENPVMAGSDNSVMAGSDNSVMAGSDRPSMRVEYWIDGERLFDYTDPTPLASGWFGFRTTLSRTQFRGFRITQTRHSPTPITLSRHSPTPITLSRYSPTRITLSRHSPTPIGESQSDSVSTN